MNVFKIFIAASIAVASTVAWAETQSVHPGQSATFHNGRVSCYNDSRRTVEIDVRSNFGGPGPDREILVVCQHNWAEEGCQMPDGSCYVTNDGVNDDATVALSRYFNVPSHRISVISHSTAHSTICGVFGGSSKTYRILR